MQLSEGYHDGTLVLFSPDEATTHLFGRGLGSLLTRGALVGLTGRLGAGKTNFVQGLAKGMGVDERILVASPTYTYLNEYPGKIPLYHMDLYRVSSLDELDELGYRDYYYGDGVCAVEWFERVPEAVPSRYLGVEIEVVEGGRLLKFRPMGGHGDQAVAGMARRFAPGHVSLEGEEGL